MRPGLIVMTALVAAAFEGWASAQPAATRPATAPATTTVATTATAPAAPAAPAAGDAGEGVRQGKVGEPVESAGVTLTIVRVSREPEARWKPIIRIARPAMP